MNKYFGVSKLYTLDSIKLCATNMIKENPNTSHQVFSPVGSLNSFSTNSENTKLKNTPDAIMIWLQLVNVPEISRGESYFIIKGDNELKRPEHTPCSNRVRKSVSIEGMNIKMPVMKAIQLTIRRDFLCYRRNVPSGEPVNQ